MTIGKIWDNFIGPFNENTLGAGQHYGMAFSPQEAGLLTKAGWYRSASGGNRKPTRLTVWRTSDQVKLWETLDPVDGGGTGWHYTTISPNLEVDAGVEYLVSMWLPTNWQHPYIDGASMPSYGTGLNKPVLFRGYGASETGYPGNRDANFAETVDIEFDTSANPPPDDDPVTSLDLENALTRWFDSSGDNTRQAELPWQTHFLTGDLQTRINALRSVADDVLATIDAAMGPGGDLVTGSVRAALDALGLSIRDHDTANRDVIMGPGNPTIADVMAEIAAIEGGDNHARDKVSIFSTDYTAGTPVVGVGAEDVLVAADAYIFEVTNPAVLRSFHVVNGDPTPRHVGSLTPIDGPALGQYIPIVWATHFLRIPGARMQGMRVLVDPEIEWEVTPYQYTPA